MLKSMLSKVRDRKGSTLALYAVMLTGLLGSMALAIDVGMAFDAHAEAQRVADSSALAGASAFMEMTGLTAEAEADTRAMAYATTNYVHGTMVDAAEVAIDPDWSTKEVEVIITRQEVPVWFARFLGIFNIDIQARAVAKVSDGGTATQCILPMTVPDLWNDRDNDTNENNIPDEDEEWDFDPEVDQYTPWDGGSGGTGYGSPYRNITPGTYEGDIGYRLFFKAGPPGQGGKSSGGSGGGTETPFGPGNFLQWRMPDPNNNCEPQAGAEHVQWNIENCNTCPVGIGTDYVWDTQPGNIAATQDELLALTNEDPDAYWDDTCKCVEGSLYADPKDSPRVRPVTFFSPEQYLQGQSDVSFNNIAWIFIEGGGQPPDHAVYARFMGVVSGGEEGPNTGPLVQYLRLIE